MSVERASRRVLGIDPGLTITGYGCIEGRADAPRLVEAGVFRLVRGSAVRGPIPQRLAELDRDFRELLDRLRPDVIAIESLFAHYKHPATAILMGHARGVLMLAAHQTGATLVELKPNMVKNALVGHGHAGKRQVQTAVRDVFGLAEAPKPPDMADALAIALCAAHRLDLDA
ncbi:MAG: crossover junction endodeoxyribonuclease RuvC [Phycisphaeraceae bacterium]|nr:crossover junction endodeoxyribonuclease RuvC [Phycisphaeraceae bacterium]MCW5755448.1 crossover junction endodeoxyribonuclease RuvC [Phycisphaeraceae bacterium]